MTRTLRMTLGACAAIASGAAYAFTPPPFPRLAGINIGSPQNYNDPTYEANLAKLSFSILSMYPGYKPGGQTMEQVVKAIKAINPNTMVFLYVNENERDESGGAFASYEQKLDQMKWWLYKTGCSGSTKVASMYGNGYYVINNSPNTKKDSSGEDAIDWMTKFYYQNYYLGGAPNADGFFMDNVVWQPYADGDWTCSGTTESHTSATASTALRQGFQRYFKDIRQLMPGKYQIGNIGNWADATSPIPEYQGMADGGVLEAYIGKSYSYEGYAGWASMMSRYHKIMTMVNAPKLVVFNGAGAITDYQTLRYELASSLMDDAYFCFTNTAINYASVPWFDEYNANLGAAVTPAQTAAWQKGVYRRDFANGIALVNPKGNGTQTVTLETAFVKLKGGQAPSVNDGSTVTQVTLKERDGIILLRKPPGHQPNPPTHVTIGN
ncbi:MAG: putative glycoside hydrolase [Steroidobacteraceae bacterium]